METVKNLCDQLGWTISDLSREARLAWPTAKNAYEGREPAPRTKKDICSALSDAIGEDIKPGDIQWKGNN